MRLEDLEIYKISREISKEAWEIYKQFDWQIRKVIGDQWMSSIDSIGANIAEAFGRYHYLDKNKFHFNARGSLFEALHWTELLLERQIISPEKAQYFKNSFKQLSIKLNNFITKIKKDASL